jgi:serine/threonine protein kinase
MKSVAPHVMKQVLPSLRREIEIMRRNYHQHIVGLMCTCETEANSIAIVMPLMKENLESYLKLNANNLTLLQRWGICYQLLLGMNWLHSQNPPILHLDLKMENILCDEKGTMKITDFGLSAILDDDAGYLESRMRTPGNVGHMAPEVIQRRKFDEKADVYSLAILMWEIMKAREWESEVVDQLRQMRIPLVGSLRDIVKRAVCTRDLRPSLLKLNWPESFKSLLIRMWALDPAERPTLCEVLANSYNQIRKDLKTEVLQAKMNAVEGRAFWGEHFDENIESAVPWSQFKTLFFRFLKITAPVNEKATNDPAVRHLLFLKLALNAHKSEMVTLDRFGCVIDAFGPINGKPNEFLDRVQLTLSNRWFRSDLTQEDALSFLLGQDDGTFIVRFSSKVGVPFTLTRVKKGKVHQTRIYKIEDWFRVGEDQSKWKNNRFESLIHIITDSAIQNAFDLRCYPQLRHVGPGEMIVLTPLEDTNYQNDGLDGSGVLEDYLSPEGPSRALNMNNLLSAI